MKIQKKRACAICKKIFMPIRVNNDKCSPTCRSVWYRESTSKRNKDRRERNAKAFVVKNCLVCNKEFKGAPHKQNCSTKCSHRYINEGVGFRHYYLKQKENHKVIAPRTIRSYEKDIPENIPFAGGEHRAERLEITREMEVFRRSGGKITVLAPEPNGSTPTVNLPYNDGGWDWQHQFGAGTYTGVEEYVNSNDNLTTNTGE